MDSNHREGTRYTYTVMNGDETRVLGCVYLLPADDFMYRNARVTSHDGTDLSSVDAMVSLWVRVSTWESGFERILLDAVLGWLRDAASSAGFHVANPVDVLASAVESLSTDLGHELTASTTKESGVHGAPLPGAAQRLDK